MNKNNSYYQIIKSTGIFGGSQVITIILGIAKNKLLAVLLGATGIGMVSIYQSIIDTVRSLSILGMDTAGVREIATTSETNNRQEIIFSVSLIERWSFILAIIGAALCLSIAYPVSIWAFKSPAYTIHICLLAFCIFFTILAMGQTIILHGLRKISYMVRCSILWNSAGLLISIPVYYYFRIQGIIPVFIVISIAMFLSALYYRKKLLLTTIPIPFQILWKRGKTVLKMGLFIVAAGILTSLTYFVVKAFISTQMGLDKVGLFQAAWTITNVYLMLVLQSMGADYYPRLCNIADKNIRVRKLVNQQTYMVYIIATPLIIMLLTGSGIILELLYTASFTEAESLLRWQIAGSFLKALSWPLGFILLAKGKGFLFFISEVIFLVVYYCCIQLLSINTGLEGAGIAYLIAYGIYLPVTYMMSKKVCNFRWNKENLLAGVVSFLLIMITFVMLHYKLVVMGYIIPVIFISIGYSIYLLNRIFPIKTLLKK